MPAERRCARGCALVFTCNRAGWVHRTARWPATPLLPDARRCVGPLGLLTGEEAGCRSEPSFVEAAHHRLEPLE